MQPQWRWLPLSTANSKFSMPTPGLKVTEFTLSAHTELLRVHSSRFGETVFNPGYGNARFSPFTDSAGVAVPTIYAGATVEVALMESVFHDVPYTTDPSLKTYDLQRLDGMVLSHISNVRDLKLAKLFGPATRNLGIAEGELIHSSASCYPYTQAWAKAIHAASDVDGLIWSSRQCASYYAVMFFGDRVLPRDLLIRVPAESLKNSAIASKAITSLASEMGLTFYDGKMLI